jgi:hypothetical protein
MPCGGDIVVRIVVRAARRGAEVGFGTGVIPEDAGHARIDVRPLAAERK